METLLDDLISLGFPNYGEVFIWPGGGFFIHRVEIETVDIEDKIKEKSLREVFENPRTVETVERQNHVEYYFRSIDHSYSTISSSSLEELWEMFKADRTGRHIPERKCFARKIFEDEYLNVK